MGDLLALADRVEKEAAGSRELDGLIFKAVYEQPGDYWSNEIFEGVWMRRDKDDRVAYDPPDQYTSSLDAAMSLVPEGDVWDVASTGAAWVDVPGSLTLFTANGNTPAAGLTAAALRALANRSAG